MMVVTLWLKKSVTVLVGRSLNTNKVFAVGQNTDLLLVALYHFSGGMVL
jgi:hypothetical protein